MPSQKTSPIKVGQVQRKVVRAFIKGTRAKKSAEYFTQKFAYHAYLAVKHRDRFARFLKIKLGDTVELIGDHWERLYGLKHTPRIWDRRILHQRIRRIPICLNFIKGNWETGLIIRHFEIPAYGGFMLTYHTAELPACFEIGKECDVFRDEEELLQKIHHYLNHPDERRAIATAGQRRALSEHLYSHRVTRLVELLRRAGVLPKTGMVPKAPPPMPRIHVEGVISESNPINPTSIV